MFPNDKNAINQNPVRINAGVRLDQIQPANTRRRIGVHVQPVNHDVTATVAGDAAPGGSQYAQWRPQYAGACLVFCLP